MRSEAAVETPVRRTGFKAHAALTRSGGRARPVAGFPDTGYLLAGDEIVWVGSSGLPMHPRAVIVEGTRAARCSAWRFDISGCRPWRPRLAAMSMIAAQAGCRALSASLDQIGAPRGFGVLLSGVTPDFPLDLGVGSVRAVAAAYQAADPRRVIEASLPLLGFGSGLTPSGDDFTGAALFARRRLALLGTDEAEAWRAAAAVLAEAVERRSHAVSAALFADLADGWSFAPLHDMAEALGEGRHDDAVNAAAALVRIGHSSGWDMLAGFVAGAAGLPANFQ